jgi:hypothetical protein
MGQIQKDGALPNLPMGLVIIISNNNKKSQKFMIGKDFNILVYLYIV